MVDTLANETPAAPSQIPVPTAEPKAVVDTSPTSATSEMGQQWPSNSIVSTEPQSGPVLSTSPEPAVGGTGLTQPIRETVTTPAVDQDAPTQPYTAAELGQNPTLETEPLTPGVITTTEPTLGSTPLPTDQDRINMLSNLTAATSGDPFGGGINPTPPIMPSATPPPSQSVAPTAVPGAEQQVAGQTPAETPKNPWWKVWKRG